MARRALHSRTAGMAAMAAGLALTLAGCNAPGLGSFTENVPAPTPRVDSQPLTGAPATVGQTYGTGPVRVGMVLPLTQNGAPSGIGQALANAAQMAIADGGAGDVTLMILDDRSSAEAAGGAAAAPNCASRLVAAANCAGAAAKTAGAANCGRGARAHIRHMVSSPFLVGRRRPLRQAVTRRASESNGGEFPYFPAFPR